jgi:hypothetical protein
MMSCSKLLLLDTLAMLVVPCVRSIPIQVQAREHCLRSSLTQPTHIDTRAAPVRKNDVDSTPAPSPLACVVQNSKFCTVLMWFQH